MTVGEVAQIVTAMASLSAVIVAGLNNHKIQELHLSVNSRLDQLLHLTHLEGITEGKIQEKQRAGKELTHG